MTDRQIRYCTTDDGVRIAYCVEGEGAPLVIQPVFMESFGLEHMLPAYRQFVEALGEGRCIVRMDVRSAGMSQRNLEELTFAKFSKDIAAVLQGARVDRVALWASTTTGQTALRFTRDHPEVVSRLVLYGTYFNMAAVFPESTCRSFAHLAESNWELASQLYADMTGRREYPEETARLADWYRDSCTGPEAAARILANIDYDLTHELEHIATPTLIIHRINDPTVPVDQARLMASALPNARLMLLPGSVHASYLGDSRAVIDAVRDFLDEDPETRAVHVAPDEPIDGAFRTILFTDLVGHTEMMRRLGDERGRDVLREHERITRELLKQCGGSEVKTMGDGFMASFASVTKAMDCAIALQRAFAAHTESMPEPLRVRVGLNAGEPIEEDGDLFGSTVIMASRITAKAGAGEILVPDTVRGVALRQGLRLRRPERVHPQRLRRRRAGMGCPLAAINSVV